MRQIAIVCCLILALAGCGRERTPPLPGLAQGNGRAAWQGASPCADCDGIETRLVLERDGKARNYVLAETFLAGNGDARFVERGRWHQDAAVLRLLDGDGGRRSYLLQDDGRLLASDAHGHALRADDAVVLTPLAPASRLRQRR